MSWAKCRLFRLGLNELAKPEVCEVRDQPKQKFVKTQIMRIILGISVMSFYVQLFCICMFITRNKYENNKPFPLFLHCFPQPHT